MRRIVRTLELGGQKPEYVGAAFVEDAALILASRIRRDGFLEPRITINLKLAEGAEITVQAEDLLENPLPRPLRIVSVHFQIHEGVLYHYRTLEFEGLESVPEKQARSYFMESQTLFRVKRARIYTPERLRRGIASLTDVLDRRGFQKARVEVGEVKRNDRTGAVDVRIRVEEGPKFVVRSIREEFYFEGAEEPREMRMVYPNRPYSQVWLQDFTSSLKTNLFHRGYPDVAVEVKTVRSQSEDGRLEQDLLATVKSGPQVRIGAVEFRGQKRTSKSLMSRRVRVQRGELLNPIRVEQGRYRLARLGVFDTVSLKYQTVAEGLRNVIYEVKEGKTLDVSLLFGWGSYEMLRGGVDVEARNLWGRAHYAEVQVV
ncbi:MAG TPA: POTRA domain-containing protein, partial [Clostridia bacterium]|nr:POTRA domain-containing protein [Clostridia bacterium]